MYTCTCYDAKVQYFSLFKLLHVFKIDPCVFFHIVLTRFSFITRDLKFHFVKAGSNSVVQMEIRGNIIFRNSQSPQSKWYWFCTGNICTSTGPTLSFHENSWTSEVFFFREVASKKTVTIWVQMTYKTKWRFPTYVCFYLYHTWLVVKQSTHVQTYPKNTTLVFTQSFSSHRKQHIHIEHVTVNPARACPRVPSSNLWQSRFLHH